MNAHIVYRLLGKRGRLLYVGSTMDLPRRLGEHRQNARLRDLIGRVETVGPYDPVTARRVERAVIEATDPPFNTEWTPRERRGVSLARRAA